jgi:hypothetical protein
VASEEGGVIETLTTDSDAIKVFVEIADDGQRAG